MSNDPFTVITMLSVEELRICGFMDATFIWNEYMLSSNDSDISRRFSFIPDLKDGAVAIAVFQCFLQQKGQPRLLGGS